MLQITLWTAGIVVLTLLVNAPLMPVLLKWTGLAKVSPVKRRIRAKAARALQRYAVQALQELQADQDEMLRGRPLDRCNSEGMHHGPACTACWRCICAKDCTVAVGRPRLCRACRQTRTRCSEVKHLLDDPPMHGLEGGW